jgi:hypothetical protein
VDRHLARVVEQPTQRASSPRPHCLRLCPTAPIVSAGRTTASIASTAGNLDRIGAGMPKSVGSIGFPMVLHPRDPDTLWVFPMDGSGVWPRTSPDGKPAAYVTRNGGKTWSRLDVGLPREQAWWGQAAGMAADGGDPIGLYFGTTSGEVWSSRTEGARWTCVARHLPEIYAVETGDAER